MEAEKSRRAAYRFERFVLDSERGALLAPDGTELPSGRNRSRCCNSSWRTRAACSTARRS